MKKIFICLFALLCFSGIVDAKPVLKPLKDYSAAYECLSQKKFIKKASESGECNPEQLNAILKGVKAIELLILIGNDNVAEGDAFVKNYLSKNNLEEIQAAAVGGFSKVGMQTYGKIDNQNICDLFLIVNMNSIMMGQSFAFYIRFEGDIALDDLKEVLDSVETTSNVKFIAQ